MALLSVLLSFVAQKVGNILQLVLGWSVTALFGKLPSTRQLLVTIALLISLLWPLFVLGLALPGVAGWAIALLPLEKWLGTSVLRALWCALALIAPAIVGVLVRIAAPAGRMSLVGAILRGYPLTLGFFLAFLVVAVTVPVVKAMSAARGWTDEHVYLHARPSQYECVLRQLAEACARAGLLPEISDAPRQMAIATTIVRALAHGMAAQLVVCKLRCIRAPGIELYLYPADLHLRGEPSKVARVRAMLSRTHVDAHAYLVASDAAQRVQDEIAHLWTVVLEHEAQGRHDGNGMGRRMRALFEELLRTDVPYADWVILESLVRRLERRLNGDGAGAAPRLDDVPDRLDEIARTANETGNLTRPEEKAHMKQHRDPGEARSSPMDEWSTSDLLKNAASEVRNLARIEMELAKEDLRNDVREAIRAGTGFGVAAAAAITAVNLLLVAAVLACRAPLACALGLGGLFLLVGTCAGGAAFAWMPKKPLERTRRRLKIDVDELSEHAT